MTIEWSGLINLGLSALSVVAVPVVVALATKGYKWMASKALINDAQHKSIIADVAIRTIKEISQAVVAETEQAKKVAAKTNTPITNEEAKESAVSTVVSSVSALLGDSIQPSDIESMAATYIEQAVKDMK